MPPIAGGAGVALDHALGVSVVTSSHTASITSSNAVPTTELVIGFGGNKQNVNITGQSLADNASNVYTTGVAYSTSTGNAWGLIVASNITTALTTSSTLTYTTTGTGILATYQPAVAAASFTGCSLTAAASAYASASNTGTSAAASVTSGSVNANDLAVLLVFAGNQSNTPSTPAGWSVIEDPVPGGTFEFGAFYMVPSSTGTLSPSSTVSGTTIPWTAMIVAFPAAPPLSLSIGSATDSTTTGESIPAIPLPGPISVTN
jgi:hypothetical protein